MTIYYLVYAWIAMLSLLLYTGKVDHEKARKWFCLLSFIAIFLMFALRHPSMGVDLRYGKPKGYLDFFQRFANYTWVEVYLENYSGYERGYALFNKVVSVISDNSQFFIGSCVAAMLIPVWYTVYKQSKQPDLSTYIFMGLPTFALMFSGLRQAIAVGICALALYWVIQQKLPAFLLTVALAMTFHKSAAIFFVAYPVYHLKLNKPLRWCSCAVPLLFYIFRQPLFTLAGKFYSAYAVPDYNNSYRLFAVFCMIYLFCCIFADERKELCGLKNLFLGACCVQALAGMHSVVMRMGYYFTIPLVLLLPLVVHTMESRKLAAFFKAAISICFIAFGIYSLRTGSWSRSYPYFAFWEW